MVGSSPPIANHLNQENIMDKIIIGLIVGLGALALIAALSLVSGTIVWILWPYAVAAFPGLVKSGALASDLSWGCAVALTFVCSILIKTSQSNTNNK